MGTARGSLRGVCRALRLAAVSMFLATLLGLQQCAAADEGNQKLENVSQQGFDSQQGEGLRLADLADILRSRKPVEVELAIGGTGVLPLQRNFRSPEATSRTRAWTT